ncbi:hypothetical protein SHELI_v1c05270 [Spiroplasma helicoides]|uniref:Transmembrane protein n=1 Tax=Spiroplasma helicoides TaxID=216938 RepID=A0A1B3SKK9_9MOLU|nr:hypothetical protein [Spiroplasma helicoides]AOG60478.1 hypothetical protein SHELI_v1c05270 [Spiroplasma helicoides]
MTKILTGIVLISFCTVLFSAVLVYINLKFYKLKKMDIKRAYINKPVFIWFNVICYLITPVLFILSLGLGVYCYIGDENIVEKFVLPFNILYITYVVFVLLMILFGDKVYKTMYIIESNEVYYFLFDLKIDKNSIRSISSTLRRNYLVISYLDSHNSVNTAQLKYNWRLKDFFSDNLESKEKDLKNKGK